MNKPVSSIPNLGPASEALYAKAGMTSAEQIRDLGADAAYTAVLKAGDPPHFIGYYALVMGLQGRPWTDCQGSEKAALRVRFDTLKANVFSPKEKGRSDLEAALDMIGVIEKR